MKDIRLMIDNLEQIETPTQNRILKSMLRNLVYHAQNQSNGSVTVSEIADFLDHSFRTNAYGNPAPESGR